MHFSNLAILLAATTTPLVASASVPHFEGFAWNPSAPIHNKGISAHDGGLWVGGQTKTKCEGNPCPPGKKTAFHVQQAGTVNMWATVPAGQEVFTAGDGRVKFTAAHDLSIPKGGSDKGFKWDAKVKGKVGRLNHVDGFVACPEGDAFPIYARTKGFDKTGCFPFDFRTAKSNTPYVWEYV